MQYFQSNIAFLQQDGPLLRAIRGVSGENGLQVLRKPQLDLAQIDFPALEGSIIMGRIKKAGEGTAGVEIL